MAPVVHTLGHSTRPFVDFLALVREHGTSELWDVRRFAASSRHPQYGRTALERAFTEAGIGYRHEPDLGGRREPRPESMSHALGDPAFRGYADYMRTPAFAAALDRLLRAAARANVAVMCAEADWRHCHRRLLADALVAKGAAVVHVTGLGQTEPHRMDPAAVVEADGRLVYSAREPQQGRLTYRRD
jgi:uncharacterized protein (DUF488 family)